MLQYIARRLLLMVPTIVAITLLVFMMLHAVPGDPATIFAGDKNVTPEQLAVVRRDMGLDRPLIVQYLDYLSRIVRAAGCCGLAQVVCAGSAKVLRKIARDGADTVEIRVHRTLPPVLSELRSAGCQLVGLEQTDRSESLYTFAFARRSVLVLGNERAGLPADVLAMLDRVVEIPVYGLPYSYNVATAAAMALYEYCRQYPEG